MQFVSGYKGIVPEEMCDKLINKFEEYKDYSPGSIRQGRDQYFGNLGRNDEQVFLNHIDSVLFNELSDYLNEAALLYVQEFDVLNGTDLVNHDIKLQRTPVGGGYSAWHCEAFDFINNGRVFTWILYLNSLPEGEGETEFFYQHKRIRPEKGTIVIFPAQYTHTHRGNPPLTTPKYIATGWYCWDTT